MKVCCKCGASESTKWFKGPTCNKCYMHQYRADHRAEYRKYREEHQSERKEYSKKYEALESTKERRRIQAKKRYHANPEIALQRARDYRTKNRTSINDHTKKYYHRNSEKCSQRNKDYIRSHRQARRSYKAKYCHTQYHSNIQYRLTVQLRSRINKIIARQQRAGSAIHDLGCTIDELMVYLESKFQPGMTWDNWGVGIGKWHIDHIYPLSKLDLTDREQFLKACHYTNLQPLWGTDNILKRDSIPTIEEE